MEHPPEVWSVPPVTPCISHQTTRDPRHLFHIRRCWKPKYHPAFPLYEAQIFQIFVLSNSTKQSPYWEHVTYLDTAQSFPAFMKIPYLLSLTDPTGCFLPILCDSESSTTRRHESEWGLLRQGKRQIPITIFTKACHWCLSCAGMVILTASNSISSRRILMFYSYLQLDFSMLLLYSRAV